MAANNRIIPKELHETRNQIRPIARRPSPPKRWTFSFRFWQQREYFGLSSKEAKWFVSLLVRLVELSRLEVDQFRSDRTVQDAWRYHPINWTQTNIPVQRADLDWIDPVYLKNETEYPLYQFMISTALGRVVGFWDENDVFNVVLLDPLHNIQPTKRFNYRVDKCYPVSCMYSSLLIELQNAQVVACTGTNCPADRAFRGLPSNDHKTEVILVPLDQTTQQSIAALIADGEIQSYSDLLESGLLYYWESKNQQ